MGLIRVKKIIVSLALVVLASQAQAQSASWSTISSAGFKSRYELTTSVLNGKIYAIGGGVPFSNLVQVYDPLTDSWMTPQVTGKFPAHYGATAAVVGDKIYIIGGVENNIDYADTVWVFSPADNVWDVAALSEGNTFTTRSEPASCVIGDDIYVIGGAHYLGYWDNTVEIFNTKSKNWRTLPANSTDSLVAVITPKAFVINDKIYVFGFLLDTSIHSNVQVYDPQTNHWSIESGSVMKAPREYYGAEEINGKIYFIGGGNLMSGGFPINTPTEVYDPFLHHWDTLITAHDTTFHNRTQLATSAINNKIFVIGGSQNVVNNVVLTLAESKVKNYNDEIYFSHRIFPNPATTTLNLVPLESPTKYKIIDVLGREIMTGMTLDHATLTLDISSLLRGIYFVFVERSDVKGVFVSVGKLCAVGSVY